LVGGQIRKNEKLVQIDPTDFALVINEAKARVKIAKQEVSLESGRSEAALQEWAIMEKRGGSALNEAAKNRALRKPQGQIAASNLKIAQNALRRAQVGYRRTILKAPFNAVVLSESVDKGQLVGPGAPVASLAGTDAFWVTTSIPTSELGWIDLPKNKRKRGKKAKKQKGSKALVRYDIGAYVIEREGYVLRQLTQVETTGRMARVVIEVPDPLGLNSDEKALLLGAQVEVRILGRSMGEVIEVPRSAIHNENEIWLFNAERSGSQGELKTASKLNTEGKQELGKLEVRQVKILRKRKDSVLIKEGLQRGDLLITSRIPTPVPGMLLRKAVSR
jgi:multidrug efflux pump subunit AcrA (membrane-fusion protein)